MLTNKTKPPKPVYKYIFQGCGIRNVDCTIGTGSAYQGNVSRTKSGKECQAWDVQFPHKHKYYPGNGYDMGNHNHCRNPDNSHDNVWCYTTDKETEFELCDARECEECDAGKKYFFQSGDLLSSSSIFIWHS
jgi:hypothetical protein